MPLNHCIGGLMSFVQSPREKTVMALFPDTLGVLVNGITDAMWSSFKREGIQVASDTEKRRRFTICMDWAVTLRGDLKWGVQRIVGAMPEILKAELSGTKYVPSQRQCWIPADGK
jgi:hypothetical protein